MNIESEVGITPFRNSWQKASISIIYSYGVLNNGYEKFFKKYGLTTQQYNALRILRDQYPEPVSTSFLREHMLDKMSDASRLVSRLGTKDLVEVTPNKADKRLVNIVISDKGLRLLSTIDKSLSELDSLLHGITEEEAEQLSVLLYKVRKHIKEVNEEKSTQVNAH